jgi:hypothetical protein
MFWDATTCRSAEVIQRFGGTYSLHLQGGRVSKESNQKEIARRGARSTLKMEVVRSFKTSMNFYRTIWSHIPENSTIYSHRSQNVNKNYLTTPRQL